MFLLRSVLILAILQAVLALECYEHDSTDKPFGDIDTDDERCQDTLDRCYKVEMKNGQRTLVKRGCANPDDFDLRPGERVVFCDTDYCNDSTSPKASLLAVILTLVTAIVVRQWN